MSERACQACGKGRRRRTRTRRERTLPCDGPGQADQATRWLLVKIGGLAWVGFSAFVVRYEVCERG